MIITKKDFAIITEASVTLKYNPIESYLGIEKSSMKSLFFLIVFAFCFVIVLAGTKTVLTGEKPSSSMFQNKACHGRPLPSAARPQKPIYAIDWHSFSYSRLEVNTLFSVLFLSDTLCSSKGKKELCKT